MDLGSTRDLDANTSPPPRSPGPHPYIGTLVPRAPWPSRDQGHEGTPSAWEPGRHPYIEDSVPRSDWSHDNKVPMAAGDLSAVDDSTTPVHRRPCHQGPWNSSVRGRSRRRQSQGPQLDRPPRHHQRLDPKAGDPPRCQGPSRPIGAQVNRRPWNLGIQPSRSGRPRMLSTLVSIEAWSPDPRSTRPTLRPGIKVPRRRVPSMPTSLRQQANDADRPPWRLGTEARVSPWELGLSVRSGRRILRALRRPCPEPSSIGQGRGVGHDPPASSERDPKKIRTTLLTRMINRVHDNNVLCGRASRAWTCRTRRIGSLGKEYQGFGAGGRHRCRIGKI